MSGHAEIVTEALIQSVMPKGGITNMALAWLGVECPPQRGWKYRILGKPRRPLPIAALMTAEQVVQISAGKKRMIERRTPDGGLLPGFDVGSPNPLERNGNQSGPDRTGVGMGIAQGTRHEGLRAVVNGSRPSLKGNSSQTGA